MASMVTGCSPEATNRRPFQTCIQGGKWLSESTTSLRWWWIQVLLCGRGSASRIESQ